MAEDYRAHYNTYRPHSSLGYRTPNEFTLDWNNNNLGLAKILAHQTGASQRRSDSLGAVNRQWVRKLRVRACVVRHITFAVRDSVIARPE